MQVRDPQKSADRFEGRDHLARVRRVSWRRWALQGFSVALAVLWAWLVLLLVGSPVGEQGEYPTAGVELSTETLTEELPALEREPKEAPSFDAEALEDELEEIVGEHEGVYGISVLEPASGTRVSLRGDEEFVAASIGKLPPFAALYAAAARGEIDLEEEISISAEDVQSYGSGGLNGFPVGYSLSLRECAYRLVNHSDNTAWAMLDRYLGNEEIVDELRSMGIEDSSYSGHSFGYYTTPDEVLLLLEKISDPRFTNDALSVEMLEVMTDTSVEDRIPEKLPEDVHVAHKTGSYEDNFGDAGVVFYRDSRGEVRRYYLAVLSEGTGEYDARDVIQEVSLAVYEAISGTTVDPNWSRGSVRQEESDPLTSPQPVPAENTEVPAESMQPKPSSAEEPPPQRSPESRYNADPDSWPAPSYPASREPAYPRPSAPAYYPEEEPGYWEYSYWEWW